MIVGNRYRHIKRGTTYEVIGLADLQSAADCLDGIQLVIYRGDADGQVWARHYPEFADGRFELVQAA